MQEEGRTKFLAMVEEIKQMVRDLWYVRILWYSTSPSRPPRGPVTGLFP